MCYASLHKCGCMSALCIRKHAYFQIAIYTQAIVLYAVTATYHFFIHYVINPPIYSHC